MHKIDGGPKLMMGILKHSQPIHGEMYTVYNTYAHINCIKEQFQATSENIQQLMLSNKKLQLCYNLF